MDATFTNSGFILKEETADDVWIFEATFAPAYQPNNVGRNERTISVEPLVDAPIVPTKSAEVAEVKPSAELRSKPHSKTQSYTQTNTQEINFAPLLFAGIMIGSICFAGGYIVGREQSNFSKIEARK